MKKTAIILSLLLLSTVICFANGAVKESFIKKTPQSMYSYIIPYSSNNERVLLKEYGLSYGSKSNNHNNYWNISYDSDNKYVDYFLQVSNDFDDISFIQSIDYIGLHSYGLNFGIAYNF
ncbi:hypothetical protein [Pectinatus sottacetonis]|uniref:hypothetical protein n=1 Tax=Pectinatus sottacetonis TaxID=1002795 RepID=UPI0018C7C914|nr:hypothetical protein [Pectinatus sottacetonis]